MLNRDGEKKSNEPILGNEHLRVYLKTLGSFDFNLKKCSKFFKTGTIFD
jgi:hypothetical protein